MLQRRMISDYWISIINGIQINEAKYPFEIDWGVKIKWKILEGYVHGTQTSKGIPKWLVYLVIGILVIGVLYLLSR